MYTFYFCAIFFFSISRIFYIHHSSIRALFFISQIFSSIVHQSEHYFTFRELFTVIIDGSGPFAFRECHPSFHWSGLFRIPRISYIHLFIDQAFLLHFANIIHPSFSLFKAFFLHFANIIHPSFYCSGPFLHISKFIHPFLSLRINLFTFWALIY